MMRRLALLIPMIGLIPFVASAQELLGDILAGKLLNPEPGVFAIYELTDKATNNHFMLRQAVVGTESVKREKGFWVEIELTPELGYPLVYKMLLTGPASDPNNIKRILFQEKRQGSAIEEIPVENLGGDAPAEAAERTLVGAETLDVAGESLSVEHFVMNADKGQDGQTEVWTNEKVRPMGIVRMVSPNGELRLRRYGKGGPEGASALRESDAGKEGPKADVKVRVESASPPTTANSADENKEEKP